MFVQAGRPARAQLRLHTLPEIVDDQVESGLGDDVNQRRENLQSPLATAKHHLPHTRDHLRLSGGSLSITLWRARACTHLQPRPKAESSAQVAASVCSQLLTAASCC